MRKLTVSVVYQGLFRKSAVSLLLRVVAAGVNYLSAIVLARALTTGDFGVLSISLSIMVLGGTFAALGIPVAIVRFLGEYRSKNDSALAHGAIRTGLCWAFLSSIAVTGVLSAGSLASNAEGWTQVGLATIMGFALVIGFAMIEVQGAIARSYDRIALALFPKDVLWRSLLIVIALLAGFYLAEADRLLAVTVAAVVALLAIACVQYLFMRRSVPQAVRAAPFAYDHSTWSTTSKPIWIAAMATMSLTYADTVITGAVLDNAEAGLYFAASRTASLASFLLFSITLIVGPEIAQAYHAGEQDKLRDILRFAALAIFVPSFALLLIFVFAGNLVLALFGPQFTAAYPMLLILSIGQTVNATAGCVALLLNMTGHQKVVAGILVSTSTIALVSMPVAGHVFGAIGIAAVVSACLALWNIRMIIHARRALGLDPSILSLVWSPR